MRILELPDIQRVLVYPQIIARMRDAVTAYSRGECDMPMPMHLAIAPEHAEVHIKSSYRRGGKYFALKIAATFPGNLARGLPVGNGMILLSCAETGEPVAFLADAGHLTDVRTAAVSAMVAHELGRRDRALGILGTGIQARLQARMHAEILDLQHICLWGRNLQLAEECRADLQAALPQTEIALARSPADVARAARLVVTATASRLPLLRAADVQPGTHISAVGADSPGKQELDPDILRRASLLLVDSRRQCEKLGELQHAPCQAGRAVEIGEYCATPVAIDPAGITVADFTGLGVEDLYIAEYCYLGAL
ncbi:MAG: ornithine cyclodeaminase family protein [Candidatus Solibacter sp.]|nr:ornithine cyclodeaminase family protein [Candidatus Solibacter sp.]